MLSQEDKIRLIHQYRTGLLEHIFDELCRKTGSSAEQVSDQIIGMSEAIRSALSEADGIGRPVRGIFVLALQQIVESFIAGLLTDEAFEWLAQEQRQADQILLHGIDLGGVQ